MTTPEIRMGLGSTVSWPPIRSGFGFRTSGVLRVWSFVIRHSRWHWHCFCPQERAKYWTWKRPIGRLMRFNHYDPGDFFDEAFSQAGQPRSAAEALVKTIESLPEGELLTRQQAAE